MTQPKLSIITINRNNVRGLSHTIASVVAQTSQQFEYLIIDGNSTDGSKEEILRNEKHLAFWCSEPDKGIYHAMNKGIQRARGEYLLFLNSGDILLDKDTIVQVIPALDGTQLVYGNLVFKGKDTEITQPYPDVLGIDYLFYQSLGHPASFIQKELFKNTPYSEDLKIVSDWEFFLKKIIIEKVSYRHIDQTISVFDMNGISSTNQELCKKECEEVLHRIFPGSMYDYIKEYVEMRRNILFPLFKELQRTQKLQHRVKPLLSLIIKVNRLFKK